ncbi:MAG: hypothetical protein IK118_03255 [Clostridia bacterium]|nr:hypothetical protein [Clostridia bacterium]
MAHFLWFRYHFGVLTQFNPENGVTPPLSGLFFFSGESKKAPKAPFDPCLTHTGFFSAKPLGHFRLDGFFFFIQIGIFTDQKFLLSTWQLLPALSPNYRS